MTISLSASDTRVHAGCQSRTERRSVLPVHLHPVEESHRLSYILPLTVNWVGFEPVFKGLEHRSEL